MRRHDFSGTALLIAAAICTATTASAAEFRAFWADAFHVGYKSSSQISSLVSRALTGNYNVIIVEVLAFHDTGPGGHGAYWNSGIVPKASDISGNIDPLAELITQAHANGIQVHAWIVSYRASSTWPPSGNATLSANPHWLMVPQADMGGGPAPVAGHYTLDPGSPDVQEYIVSIVRELATNYDIDGINLDYIRYIQTDAGYPADTSYSKSSLARFQALTGFGGTPPPTGNTSWNDFRRQTIDELVRRLRAELPSITGNPQQPLWLTADLITFGNAPSSFTSSDAYNLFQNWKFWMEQGYLDAGIPMNYKRESSSSQANWYRNWVDAALNWSGDRHLVAGQGNYLNKKSDSVTQMAYALAQGADGACNFSYASTADEDLNGTPEQDWSWYSYVASNLYTSPASVPTLPWRNAATATEGTAWGRVYDDASGAPFDGATVQVGGLPAVQTDGNGYYVATLIPSSGGGSTYDVTATAAGCPTGSVSNVLVPPGGIVRVDFALCPVTFPLGDMDEDGDIDAADFGLFSFCMLGPDVTFPGGNLCLQGDFDGDQDVDLSDFAGFQQVFGTP
ncbi:MAG: hypothetical protein D6744_07970 [Planctomycetota bacterium]|nr:MAG: hypothetical protein D6744_07970 [Planctomycetota bacterium]